MANSLSAVAAEKPGKGDPLRLLVAGLERVAGPGAKPSRNSGLFAQLASRYRVVGQVFPEVGALASYGLKLRYFRPRRADWRQRAGLNQWTFKLLTKDAGRQLTTWTGRYDVILMLQTLFAPGPHPERLPFAIYTDNIHTLTARHAPHWAPFNQRQRQARIALERETCRKAGRIFAMSEFLRRALIEDYGCDPRLVIHVGAGANSITESIDEKRYDRQIALFVGINFALKGGPTLLRAWELVRERLPEAELWVVGPPRPGAELARGVRYMGFIGREKLAELYDRASVFVLPSSYDAYPHALREAMGHGLPCIGTARGGVPENIDADETGLLIEPDDHVLLAEAIVKVLADPDRARQMGHAAYAEVLRTHTWAKVAERMAPHLDAVAAERAK